MGIWGFDASISDGPWDVGPLGTDDGAVGDWGDGRVRPAGRWEWKFRFRRRGPKETPPEACGSDIKGLQGLLAAISGVGPSAGLAPKDLDIATHDLGDNGWVLFHLGKQDHGDDGAGKSLRI